MRDSRYRNAGFTLIELIMVLVLIGIISALGIGLFASKSGFSAFLARESFINAALLAQKQALSNQSSGNPVTLTLTQQTNAWIFATPDNNPAASQQAERSQANLWINGARVPNGSQYVVTYGANGSVGANIQFQFEGKGDYPACIASTGFAYAGVCAE